MALTEVEERKGKRRCRGTVSGNAGLHLGHVKLCSVDFLPFRVAHAERFLLQHMTMSRTGDSCMVWLAKVSMRHDLLYEMGNVFPRRFGRGSGRSAKVIRCRIVLGMAWVALVMILYVSLTLGEGHGPDGNQLRDLVSRLARRVRKGMR
jgi:hypothetical protein